MLYNQNVKSNSGFNAVRSIDNRKRNLPFLSTILIALIIVILIWFFRGGSFKLYASIFFSYYFLTKQIWLSVILIGITQNILFLPLRFIGLKLSTRLKYFESEIDQTNENQQYLMLNKKVREGDSSVLFYIFNFLIQSIAFFSAGRIFLIDFYTQPLNPKYLYDFIPYPQYPLTGTNFHFPFFNVTSTTAVSWTLIFQIWLAILIIFVAPRLLWRLIRFIFRKNKKILEFRINYNKMLLWISGFGSTLFVLSIIFLRHLPTSMEFKWLIADLTRQNTTMNFVTAVGTFITVFHAGYISGKIIVEKAKAANFPLLRINAIFRAHLRSSFKNALLLGIGAFLVPSQIPSAFELSVATFEVLYIISPITFDHLLKRANNRTQPTPPVPVETAS